MCLRPLSHGKHLENLCKIGYVPGIFRVANLKGIHMSKQHPECPLYNHATCKELHNHKLCAIIREDKTCLKKQQKPKKELPEEKALPE